MYKAFTVALALFAATIAGQAYSADLVQGYRLQPKAHYHMQHEKRVYVRRAAEECDLLRVDYRAPYLPHTEIVRSCAPPLNLRPARSGSSGGDYRYVAVDVPVIQY